MRNLDRSAWQSLLEADVEFRRACRAWTGSLALFDGTVHALLGVLDGSVAEAAVAVGIPAADITFEGPPEGWQHVFEAAPPPYYQDLLGGAVAHHGFEVHGDLLQLAVRYPAVQRAVALAGVAMRESS